jgi:hypothetical protein
MQPSINAALARTRADDIARRAAKQRPHRYAPPHVVETPPPVGPGTFDPRVW